MEQTFMTIHNLGPDANILFASESIADILGYQPSEVHGKSAFDYFHPEEVPFARSVHSRGVLLDKAAVLHYARILNWDGRWIGCECCFTIVHDVLVACTSIYRRNAKSERRAIEAPQIRRLFACSPRDPRYHMLEHLSPKFKMPAMEREPRAALILNRFTRNLTIMFATTSISAVVGLTPTELKSKSFYRCIQENCLSEAIKCLESAKANDSIAYLRFSFQDPREDDDEISDAISDDSHDEDEQMDDDDGGDDGDDDDDSEDRRRKRPRIEVPDTATRPSGRRNSLVPIKLEDDDYDHKIMSMPDLPDISQASRSQSPFSLPAPSSIELEAVVSCTSDGLVVILRKARPPIPPAHPPLVSFDYGDGLFAAPWGQHPIRPHFPQESLHTFQPPLLPQYMPLRENVKDAGGPPLDVLMGSIRDVAVFAWGVVGINPAMAAYGRGLPSGDARPTHGASRQGHIQDTRASEASTGSGSTNLYHTTTTPAGSPRFPSTTSDKGKTSEITAAQPMESLHAGRSLTSPASCGAYRPKEETVAASRCSVQSSQAGPGAYLSRGWPGERPQYMSDHAPHRHRYAESHGQPCVVPSSSPAGFAMPAPCQQPLPALSRDPGCQPVGYGSSVAQSPTPNATGTRDGRLYGWH